MSATAPNTPNTTPIATAATFVEGGGADVGAKVGGLHASTLESANESPGVYGANPRFLIVRKEVVLLALNEHVAPRSAVESGGASGSSDSRISMELPTHDTERFAFSTTSSVLGSTAVEAM